MESVVGRLLGSYEQGKITRRQFVEGVALLAAGTATAPAALSAEIVAPIVPVSINHIAISVSDVKRSTDWYTRILKLKVITQNEHFSLLQFGNTQLVVRSRTERRPTLVPGTVTHFMLGVAPYDEVALEATLKAQGLTPKKDMESFVVKDPDNLSVQIGEVKMGLDTGYPAASS